eukprot:671479-Rhodomonas_salina.2
MMCSVVYPAGVYRVCCDRPRDSHTTGLTPRGQTAHAAPSLSHPPTPGSYSLLRVILVSILFFQSVKAGKAAVGARIDGRGHSLPCCLPHAVPAHAIARARVAMHVVTHTHTHTHTQRAHAQPSLATEAYTQCGHAVLGHAVFSHAVFGHMVFGHAVFGHKVFGAVWCGHAVLGHAHAVLGHAVLGHAVLGHA